MNDMPSADSKRFWRRHLAILGVIILSGCAAHAIPHTAPAAPGFWLGFWQGFIAPITFVVSLFNHNVAVYAIPNKGWLYDLGFIMGLSLFLSGTLRRQGKH